MSDDLSPPPVCGRCLRPSVELFEFCLTIFAIRPRAKKSLPIVKVDAVYCADCLCDVRAAMTQKKEPTS